MSIYQVAVQMEYDSQERMVNVMHYEFPDYVPTAAQLQEATDALDHQYNDNIASIMSTLMVCTGYNWRRVDVGDLPVAEIDATGGNWIGGDGSNSLASQLCCVATWKAPTAFPRSTRNYLGVLGGSVLGAGGTIIPSATALVTDWAEGIEELTIAAADNARRVAVRYGGDPRVVEAHNVVTFQKVTSIFGTQRRRRRGVGQ